jgi:hypothetical protein
VTLVDSLWQRRDGDFHHASHEHLDVQGRAEGWSCSGRNGSGMLGNSNYSTEKLIEREVSEVSTGFIRVRRRLWTPAVSFRSELFAPSFIKLECPFPTIVLCNKCSMGTTRYTQDCSQNLVSEITIVPNPRLRLNTLEVERIRLFRQHHHSHQSYARQV